MNHLKFIYIPWPESQKYINLYDEDSEDIQLGDDGALFIEEDFFNNITQ